ncbi:MAG TPA: LacI family DNA-binding transcriptional regulator [Sphingomicrobium sp.]|nr:LacI family DNA-binding transcriptional regulator [Sphingomicrobium sp.]
MERPSRRRRGAVTIVDVAQAAGVSAMTVSRALNSGGKISEQTRASVLRVIEELGYTPNPSARSLAAGRPNQIGFVYSGITVAFLKNFLAGAVARARQTDNQLVVETCDLNDETSQREAARRMANADVRGVILTPPISESSPLVEELQRLKIRFASVAVANPSDNPLTVRIDHRRAAAEITRHLVELGHRRIGFVRGNPAYQSATERELGFRDALKAAGIDPADCPVVQGYYNLESGIAAAERLVQLQPRPTAIFASNDDMAAGVIYVAHQRGIAVPSDLTVVGFDDMETALIVWPQLTTIRQPVAQMAASAIDLLLDDLEKQDQGLPPTTAEIVLDYEFIVRNSSAPPTETPAHSTDH